MTTLPVGDVDSVSDVSSSSVPCSALQLTGEERAVLRKSAAADMKKHGFKTVDELTDYYDKKRGY